MIPTFHPSRLLCSRNVTSASRNTVDRSHDQMCMCVRCMDARIAELMIRNEEEPR